MDQGEMGRHLPFFIVFVRMEGTMVDELLESDDESLRRIDCPVLVTERLVMRPPHATDAEDLAAIANNRRVAEMLARMPHPYGVTEAKDFIARSAERNDGCIYALTLGASGRLIGCAGLEDRGAGLELGYWLGQPFWNKGYATEAAHALVDLAFRATDADAVMAACRVSNMASRRVIQKCGFQLAGHGMMSSLVAGQVSTERYKLDRATWVALRSWASKA